MIPDTRKNELRVLAGRIATVAVLIFGLRTVGILIATGLHWKQAGGELLGSVLTMVGAVLMGRSVRPKPVTHRNIVSTAVSTQKRTLFLFALGASLSLLTLHLAILDAAGPVQWAPLLSSHRLWEVVAYLTCYAILGPIYEEILFRGYLQESIARMMGLSASIILPSVLFGLAHWSSLSAMLFASLFGLSQGMYRAWGGSLALCCAIHLIHNLIVYGDKYFFGHFVRI